MRLVSDDLHMDYTAMGQTVHLASRMEQLAVRGSIALSPRDAAAGRGIRPGPVARARADQGRGRPGRGLRAARRGPGPDAPAGGGGAGPHPLRRARRPRSSALHGALDRARGRGHGQVVALVGEPGVGKSRLVWEVVDSHRGRRLADPARGAPVSYGKATVLPAGDRPARRTAGSRRRDDERTIREKVTGKVLALDRGARARPPGPARSARRLAPRTTAWAALDPAQRRRRRSTPCAAAAAREPGAAVAAGGRGSPLDRLGDPGAARQPGREPAGRAHAAAGQLPARVQPQLGQQALLRPAPHRPAGRETAPTRSSTACSAPIRLSRR